MDTFRFSDYQLGNIIGSGTFGKVYVISNADETKSYAAKIFKNNIQYDFHQLRREVEILSKLNHPAILQFITFGQHNFKKKIKPVLVTELAQKKTLCDIINDERLSLASEQWTLTQKLIVIYGIASAMAFLHENRIIHRDLKPDNILMDENFNPKVADFGLSKVLHQNEDSISMQSMSGVKGTPMYMSPEALTKGEYTKEGDVYSFAMIAYQIMTSERLLNDKNIATFSDRIQKGERPQFSVPIPHPFKELIESAWSQNPADRPTFSEIVEQLRTNESFITDEIDQDQFLDYIDYLDGKGSSYDSKRTLFKKETRKPKEKESLCPIGLFNAFDDQRKEFIKAAETDREKQYLLGNFFLEGIESFPQNTNLAIKYLDASIKSGSIEGVKYYCNLLIRGVFVEANIDQAKFYLEPFLKCHDGTIYLLYGRVLKKQSKYQEARRYFWKASKEGSSDGMYEYGKMLFKGEGGERNIEDAHRFFNLSKKNGCFKAYEYFMKHNSESR